MKQIRPLLILCFLFLSAIVNGQSIYISADATSGCSPLIDAFNDSSSLGSGHTYKWIVSKNDTVRIDTIAITSTTSSPNTLNYTFTVSGTYSVTEVVTTGTLTATAIKQIIIAHPPVINFATSPALPVDSLCFPVTINFVNTSTDTSACANSWSWLITDSAGFHSQTFENVTSPVCTFTASGSYNVICTLSNCCVANQTLTRIHYINVAQPVVAGFNTVNNDTACHLPAIVHFVNTSTGATHYLWKFGNGISSTLVNPIITFTDTLYYNDTLIAYNAGGCNDTIVILNDVHIPAFHYGFTAPSQICANVNFVCHDTTHGWVSNGWKIYPVSGGSYTASVNDSPSIASSIPVAGNFVIYDSTSSGVCWNIQRDTITVFGLPTVSVSAFHNYRCTPPDTAQFSATAFGPATITNWLWQFGDPYSIASHKDTASTVGYAVHIFTNSGGTPAIGGGTYSDTVFVTDINGCIGTTNNQLVNISPTNKILSMTADSGCAPLLVTYTVIATAPAGAAFILDSVVYNDGTPDCIGGGCLPGSHTYTAAGVYKLWVWYHTPDSVGGCTFKDSINVHVGSTHPNFHLSISADSVCPQTVVILDDSCINCTSRKWTNITGVGRFTGRADSTYDSLVHLTTPGIDSIKWLGDDNGCYIRIDTFIWVFKPLALITPSTPDCTNLLTINFSAMGSTGATGYHWSFGDGSVSTGISAVHTFSALGSYSVVLVDTANNAANHYCTNKDTLVLPIYPFVDTFHVANLSPCINTIDSFKGSLAPPMGTPYMTYIWKYGDGTTSTFTRNPSSGHSYARSGSYHDTLIIGNSTGCFDTARSLINVYGPNMHISVAGLPVSPSYTVCADAPIFIADSSTDLLPAVISYRQWTMTPPDSSFMTALNDTTFIFAEGSRIIYITDSDYLHCWNQQAVNITAVKPHAFFYSPDSSQHLCKGIQIPLYDTNSFCTYMWHFGDGTVDTTTTQLTTHIFSVDATFSDTVYIATGPGGLYPVGCLDTFIKNHQFSLSEISAAFNISPAIQNKICPPIVGSALVTGRITGYTYWWQISSTAGYPYATLAYDDSDAIFSYNDSLPGIYTITLHDSNSVGCQASSVPDTFNIGGEAGVYSLITVDSGCIPFRAIFTFTDTSIYPITNYFWSVNGASNIGAFTASDTAIFYTPGIYDSFYLNVKSSVGGTTCRVNYPLPYIISVFGIPTVTVVAPSLICNGVDTTFIASGAPVISWLPSTHLSDSTGDTVVFNGHISSPPYVLSYMVIGNNNGCIDTAHFTVVVDTPLTPIIITGKDSICKGLSDTLVASGMTGSYQWLGGFGTSSFGDTNIVSPIITIVDTVYAIDGRGCSDTATFRVKVIAVPILASTITPSPICDSSLFHYVATSFLDGTVITWSRDSIPGIKNGAANGIDSVNEILINTTPNPINVVYIDTLSLQGCSSVSEVTVTVYPKPVLTNTLTGTSICDSTLFVFAPSSLTSGTTYYWSRATVPGILNMSGSGIDSIKEILVNTTDSVVKVIYKDSLSANGCPNVENITIKVNPALRLINDSSFIMCSGLVFNYHPSALATGATFLWSRAVVTGISSGAGSGSGNISEMLSNTTSVAAHVVYVYTISANSCTDEQSVNLTVQPKPLPPAISLNPGDSICVGTLNQNFGANAAPPAGEQYTWSAVNAIVWDNGASGQYSLVNFDNAGTAIIILSANYTGSSCTTSDSFYVNVGVGPAPDGYVVWIDSQFIYLNSTVNSYQWGYDSISSLDSSIISGATYQNYYNPNPDTASKHYWVIVSENGCKQKAYYNAPNGISAVNQESSGMDLYPNPTDNSVNINLHSKLNGPVVVYMADISGRIIKKMKSTNMKFQVDVSDLANGSYFINCYQQGIKIATAHLIKE